MQSRCQNVASLSMFNLWRGGASSMANKNNGPLHRHYSHWLVEEIISTFHLVRRNVKVLPKQQPWRGWESKNKEPPREHRRGSELARAVNRYYFFASFLWQTSMERERREVKSFQFFSRTQLLCYLRSIVATSFARYYNHIMQITIIHFLLSRRTFFLSSSSSTHSLPLGYNFWLLETNLQFFTRNDGWISISHSVTGDGLFNADFRRFACKFAWIAEQFSLELNLSIVYKSRISASHRSFECGVGILFEILTTAAHEMENKWKFWAASLSPTREYSRLTIEFAGQTIRRVELKEFNLSLERAQEQLSSRGWMARKSENNRDRQYTAIMNAKLFNLSSLSYRSIQARVVLWMLFRDLLFSSLSIRYVVIVDVGRGYIDNRR